MNTARAEVIARRLHKITGLPTKLSTICERFNIALRFANLKDVDSYYLFHQNKRFIVVNDAHSRTRQRFSIAHEIGHAARYHGPLMFSRESKGFIERPRWQEVEANRFAAELLMPKSELKRHGYLTPKQIAAMCDVSPEAATYRAIELGWLQRELAFTILAN